MASGVRLVVGTGGFAAWTSDDLGETWFRPYIEQGMYPEARVWSLAGDSSEPGRVYAGTDGGIHVLESGGRQWQHLPSALDGLPVWSLAQSPHDAGTLYAGTQAPAAVYRSTDRGRNWSRLPTRFAESCIFVGRPRVTQVLLDPEDPQRLFAGIEIDAVHRSDDGGRSWRRLAKGLVSEDVHWLAWAGEGGGRLLFATTNKGLHRSRDLGESWEFLPLDSPWQYTRMIVQHADGVVYLCNGNGPPGSAGRLRRSRDGGSTWQDAGLPETLNSTPWCVAAHPSAPEIVFACTNLGQIYRSTDGAETWTKLERELGEIRAAVCVPLP